MICDNLETLENDTITPLEWSTDNDVQKFENEIVMWKTYSTHINDADDTNDD